MHEHGHHGHSHGGDGPPWLNALLLTLVILLVIASAIGLWISRNTDLITKP